MIRMNDEMISSREIKQIRSLATKKGREESGLFTVEGEKIVSEALASCFEVVKVYRTEEIGQEAMGRISALSTPSPALAVLRQKESREPRVPSDGLILCLDSIRDPGNLGTIIRVADWFGVKEIVASEDTVELYNPKTVQATMGAIFRVNVSYCDIIRYAKDTVKSGGKVYGTFLDGENIYRKPLETGETAPAVIVIGNESRGISREMDAVVSDRLFIPSFPGDGSLTSESLNAAIATAITLAEFRRRIWASR